MVEENNSVNVYYHKHCGKPLVGTKNIERSNLITDNNYPLSGMAYCNKCRITVDLDDIDAIETSKITINDSLIPIKTQKTKKKVNKTLDSFL